MTSALRHLEEQARVEKAPIAAAERARRGAVPLPLPDEVVAKVVDLERRLAADPLAGRERLRRLFRDGTVRLAPQPDGTYVARSELFVLTLLAENEEPRNHHSCDFAVSSEGSGGPLIELPRARIPFRRCLEIGLW